MSVIQVLIGLIYIGFACGIKSRSLIFTTQLRELKSSLVACEVKLRELETENSKFRDDSLRQTAMIHTLKQRIEELQDATVSRGEKALSALQQDSKEQQERIFELESRIRDLTNDREEAEQKTQSWQRKFDEITLHLQRTISVEEEEPELLIEKVMQYVKSGKQPIIM